MKNDLLPIKDNDHDEYLCLAAGNIRPESVCNDPSCIMQNTGEKTSTTRSMLGRF